VSRAGGRALIRFGTDGWRARIAEDFTFANLERVAQAYADYLLRQSEEARARLRLKLLEQKLEDMHAQLKEERHGDVFVRNTLYADRDDPLLNDTSAPLVVVGYDRRFLSEHFAVRAAEVLAANKFRVALYNEPVPTPLVSWAVHDQRAAGGVVITASHNPPDFNGFKIKADFGGSAPPEITTAVESLIDAQHPRRVELKDDGETALLNAATESYCAQVASYIDLERVRRARMRVVIDPMHGSGGRWVESFLRHGRLEAETIRAERDPLFGGVNPEPIDRNLVPLCERVVATRAHLGLATDGDADRVGAVNELGETMTMHEVVPLLLLHLARQRGMSGGVVRTFSQSILTKRIAAAHNLKLYETPIGFKYIADLMLREDILIGAEESGGIGVRGHIPERDGILNSLLLLEAVVAAGKPPSEMVRDMHREFGEFYFGRRDLHREVERGMELVASLGASAPASVAGYKVSGVETLDGTKLLFDDESWLLFRQSGTEPVLRIYSEATSKAKATALLDEGTRLAFTER
jgi:phosphomannomutase